MRAPEFEASLHDAKIYPQLWRLLLGMVFVLFLWLSVAAFVVGGIVVLSGLIAPSSTFYVSAGLRSIQNTVSGYGGLDTPIAVILLLSTFIGLFIAPMLAAAAFHFRGPGSLFGPFPEWVRGFGTALLVQGPILAALFLVGAFVDAPLPNLAFDRWLTVLPFALPLIFIQTGAEELLFRGYLQQQLAARFAARWIWMGIPAVLFASLHWTPTAGATLPFILAAALVFALIAADLTEQTGSLGAAMGLHFGNNVFGMLIVAVSETVTGLALYVSPDPVSETGALSFGIGVSIAIMLVIWRITRHLLTR